MQSPSSAHSDLSLSLFGLHSDRQWAGAPATVLSSSVTIGFCVSHVCAAERSVSRDCQNGGLSYSACLFRRSHAGLQWCRLRYNGNCTGVCACVCEVVMAMVCEVVMAMVCEVMMAMVCEVWWQWCVRSWWWCCVCVVCVCVLVCIDRKGLFSLFDVCVSRKV